MKKYSTSVSKLIKRKDLYEYLKLDKNSKEKILVKFGFDLSTIDFEESEITLKILIDEEFIKLTPTVNMSYYDETDKLTKRVRKVPNNDDLVSFEGEIYEELSFKSEQEAREFADMYGYGTHIFEGTIALIHFKGLEWNNAKIDNVSDIKNITEKFNGIIKDRDYDILRSTLARALETKEVFIAKSKNFYNIYYGNIPVSKINNSKEGFSITELDDIIGYLEHEVPDKGYFSLFARDAVKILKSNLLNRGYNPNKEFISNKSKQTYVDVISSTNIVPNENVYVKLKVVSNHPVVLVDSKLESRDRETEIDKKYFVKIK